MHKLPVSHFSEHKERERELRDNFAGEKEMSEENKEKAGDGILENLEETGDPGGDRKEEKPELEVEDEKADEDRDEESKDFTKSPGAMSSENSAAIENLMEAKTEEGGEDIKLENLDTKSSGLESGEYNETEIR